MSNTKIDNSIIGIRSKSNTSCNWTGTADFGRLVPIHWKEMFEGDKCLHFQPRIELQMLNLASPTFGKIDLYLHTFFVPTRLIWKDAYDFFSGQGPNSNAIPPYWTLANLADAYDSAQTTGLKRAYYKHWTSLGLPPFFENSSYLTSANNSANNARRTMLPFRAYSQIWWDFYRDPEVLRDSSKPAYLVDASGAFSSTLPEFQTLEPRLRSLKDNWIANLYSQSGLEYSIMGIEIANSTLNPGLWSASATNANITKAGNAANPGITSGRTEMIGQLTEPELRKMEALTRLSERLSLGGKRQIEAMFAAYGVKPNYLQMQMCQYLGGSKETVAIDDIISTADTSVMDAPATSGSNGAPLGAKAGAGYCRLMDFDCQFTAPEHGYFMCILSIMPHVHFVQGFNKMWTRNSKEDFFTKQLEHVGQVAVRKDEIGVRRNAGPSYDRTQDDDVFAYSQPYYEYKCGQDILAGDFMKYHNDASATADGTIIQDVQYMQSMEMYIDYDQFRNFDINSLLIDGPKFNKIFYYLGGSVWTDSDDHFHICADKHILKDTNEDDYAVPTLETTQAPHKAQQAIGGDTVF